MTTSELVESLTKSGISLSVVGDKLHYKPTPNPVILEEMRQHKAEIISFLVAQVSPTLRGEKKAKVDTDLEELRDERAAIMQFDAGLPREEAERLALLEHPGPR